MVNGNKTYPSDGSDGGTRGSRFRENVPPLPPDSDDDSDVTLNSESDESDDSSVGDYDPSLSLSSGGDDDDSETVVKEIPRTKTKKRTDADSSGESDFEIKPDGRKAVKNETAVVSKPRRSSSATKHADVTRRKSDEFESAKNSTSVYRTIAETERALDDMILRRDRIYETSPSQARTEFFSRLLPVFVKTHLLLIDSISLPSRFVPTVMQRQGVRASFTFENLRVFSFDNATLLLDHRYYKTDDYVLKIVGRPVNAKLAAFPKTLTDETNVFTGAGEDRSVPSRHFVGSLVLRPNYAFKNPGKTRTERHALHRFSDAALPPSLWWNAYDPNVSEGGVYVDKMYEALKERPLAVDLLFLLGEVNAADNTVNGLKGRAKWESLNDRPSDRTVLTIHMMLCFGFRILSFGVLCEYPKTATADWIAGHGDGDRKNAYAAKRRSLMNSHTYRDTSGSGIKKRLVMRMVYALDTLSAVKKFCRVTDTHEKTFKSRVVRSRLFYRTTVPWDVVGASYAYPNSSLYMVVGSCNMVYTARKMSACTESLTESMLEKLSDKPRDGFDKTDRPAGRAAVKRERRPPPRKQGEPAHESASTSAKLPVDEHGLVTNVRLPAKRTLPPHEAVPPSKRTVAGFGVGGFPVKRHLPPHAAAPPNKRAAGVEVVAPHRLARSRAPISLSPCAKHR